MACCSRSLGRERNIERAMLEEKNLIVMYEMPLKPEHSLPPILGWCHGSLTKHAGVYVAPKSTMHETTSNFSNPLLVFMCVDTGHIIALVTKWEVEHQPHDSWTFWLYTSWQQWHNVWGKSSLFPKLFGLPLWHYRFSSCGITRVYPLVSGFGPETSPSNPKWDMFHVCLMFSLK